MLSLLLLLGTVQPLANAASISESVDNSPNISEGISGTPSCRQLRSVDNSPNQNLPISVSKSGERSELGAPKVPDLFKPTPPGPQAYGPRSKRALKQGNGRAKPAPRSSGGKVEVPVDVGVGPVGLLGLNQLVLDQPLHVGLALSIAAVIDKQLILRYRDRIPAAYRNMANNVETVYVSPWWLALVPETFIISPGIWNTGLYGAIWRVLGLGLPFKLGPATLTLGAKLSLCYLFMHSSTLPSPTHFLRPGVHLHATVLVPITDTFLLSAGWASDVFIPQPLGQPPWTFWPLDDALWHLGGPFLKLHVRIPMEVAL